MEVQFTVFIRIEISGTDSNVKKLRKAKRAILDTPPITLPLETYLGFILLNKEMREKKRKNATFA